MHRAIQQPTNRQPHATTVASEWGKTFLTQTVIGILLAVLWATLGLQ
jgi:preprotein translocase subunit SecF